MTFLELTFSSKDNFNCVQTNAYIWMPMPMPTPMPKCQCRDFQMAVRKYFSNLSYKFEINRSISSFFFPLMGQIGKELL